MRPISAQIVPSIQIKVTAKNLADVVPVASVPVFLKLVPHVNTKEEIPDVEIKKVTLCPATPPLALKVHDPVGVTVITLEVILTVIVPVVALVAAAPDIPPLANDSIVIRLCFVLNAVCTCDILDMAIVSPSPRTKYIVSLRINCPLLCAMEFKEIRNRIIVIIYFIIKAFLLSQKLNLQERCL